MRIATAREQFGIATAAEQHAWLLERSSVKQRLRVLGVGPKDIGDPGDPDAGAPPAVAYVNHGRWVADCPTEGCGGAITLVPGAPFMCGNCLNAEIGHRYRLVAWSDEHAAIERALEPRAIPEQCNWRPGETVADLLAENAAATHRRAALEAARLGLPLEGVLP